MDAITQFELLSDAEQLAVIGGQFWAFAIVAGLMDRLRTKRRNVVRLDKVGWVPWTGVMMGAAMIGGGCLLMAMSAR
jgi:hypothetical protein